MASIHRGSQASSDAMFIMWHSDDAIRQILLEDIRRKSMELTIDDNAEAHFRMIRLREQADAKADRGGETANNGRSRRTGSRMHTIHIVGRLATTFSNVGR
mgnify:FL=1